MSRITDMRSDLQAEKLWDWVAVKMTTCRRPGHIVATPLQTAQFVYTVVMQLYFYQASSSSSSSWDCVDSAGPLRQT